MKIINPATEEIIEHLEEDSAESVAAKLKLLQEGQKAWSARTVKERLACITMFGELIKTNEDSLATILTEETGKPLQQSLNEIRGAQNRIDHLSNNAEKWLASEKFTDTGATHEHINYEPLGVIANISAWNFPYNVGYNVFLYALVAGNSVMYKPSEFAALTGKQFEMYLWQADVPENVFQCVNGAKEVGQQILELDLDGYFFTGSYQTGKHIAKTVAHKLVPVQLELGGKEALYVMDDVEDVKMAAINAAEGAFYNNGQSCCALERIYVEESIYDTFVDALVTEVESYKMGDPAELDTFLGALTRQQQIEVLNEQVKDAIEKGAVLKTGGKAVDGNGYFYEPTVLANTNHTMLVMTEESFGPIIAIKQVSGDEEATTAMLDSDFGLTSAVFSKSEERAKAILDQMNTGTVYWNCCDRVSPDVPWSGRKNSGTGSTLSSQGIRAFVQPKAYHLRYS